MVFSASLRDMVVTDMVAEQQMSLLRIIAEELQFGTFKLWQTIGNGGGQRRRASFYREERRKLAGVVLNKSSFIGGERELEVVVASHRL